MSRRPLYAYEYAAVQYDDAVALLAEDAAALLQDATATTVEHAERVVTELHVDLAGFEVGREVAIDVGEFDPVEVRRSRIPLSWRAVHGGGLFPAVEADLELTAISFHPPRTQVTLVGSYRPPLGVLGAAADVAAGHIVAEAAIKRFVEDVAARLQRRVPAAEPV